MRILTFLGSLIFAFQSDLAFANSSSRTGLGSVSAHRGRLSSLSQEGQDALRSFVERNTVTAPNRRVVGRAGDPNTAFDSGAPNSRERNAAYVLQSRLENETILTVQAMELRDNGLRETIFRVPGSQIHRRQTSDGQSVDVRYEDNRIELGFNVGPRDAQTRQNLWFRLPENPGGTQALEVHTITRPDGERLAFGRLESPRTLEIELAPGLRSHAPKVTDARITIGEGQGEIVFFEIQSDLRTVAVFTSTGHRIDYEISDGLMPGRESAEFVTRRLSTTRYATSQFRVTDRTYPRQRAGAGDANGLAPSRTAP